MKWIICFLGLILFGVQADAQQNVSKNFCLSCDTNGVGSDALVLVNKKIVPFAYVNLLNAEVVDSVYIGRSAKLVAKYGQAASKGVIEITLKKYMSWVSLNSILQKNNIKKEDRNLPVFFKSIRLKEGFLLADKNKTLKIEVLDSANDEAVSTTVSGKYLAVSETNM